MCVSRTAEDQAEGAVVVVLDEISTTARLGVDQRGCISGSGREWTPPSQPVGTPDHLRHHLISTMPVRPVRSRTPEVAPGAPNLDALIGFGEEAWSFAMISRTGVVAVFDPPGRDVHELPGRLEGPPLPAEPLKGPNRPAEHGGGSVAVVKRPMENMLAARDGAPPHRSAALRSST